jgi:hypothetical protein
MLVIYCNITEKVEKKLGHCESCKVSSLGMVILQNNKESTKQKQKRQKHKKDKEIFLICHTSRLFYNILFKWCKPCIVI